MKNEIKFVLSAVFLLVFGTYLSGTILPLYAKSLGGNGFTIGILSCSLYIVRLLIGTPVGILADKKGTVKVLKYSLMLYPLIAIAYCLSINIPSLIGSRLFHGVASAMMLPMAMAYIGQVSPKGKEGRYMGIYNTIIFLASGIGPFVATVIADFFSYRATFLALLILAAASLLIFLLAVKPINYAKDNSPPVVSKNAVAKGLLFKNTGLLALSSINIALAVISSFIGFFFIIVASSIKIGLVTTGAILAAYNIFSGALQIPLGRLSDKGNKFVMVVVSGIVTAIAFLIINLTRNTGFIIALLLVVALGTSVMLASSSALSASIGKNIGMGSTMGFLATSNSFGMIVGSLLLGLMPGNYFLFYLCSVTTLICILAFCALWRYYIKKIKFQHLQSRF